MGIIKADLQAMIHIARRGTDFTSTLTIGRQSVFIKPAEAYGTLKKHAPITPQRAMELCEQQYAEVIFEWFGAESVASLDFSGYEQATILHDMNLPVGEELRNRYSLVWDGGTLEHVFNYPVALRNCMEMVATGGHLVLHTPANNFFGHGFYQFSPELFFSVLTEQNGFTDTRLLMRDDRSQWYEVASPHEIGRRVDLCRARRKEALLLVVSRKTGDVPPTLAVQQSDYEQLWKTDGSGATGGKSRSPLRRLPLWIRKPVYILLAPLIARRRRRRLLRLFYTRVDL